MGVSTQAFGTRVPVADPAGQPRSPATSIASAARCPRSRAIPITGPGTRPGRRGRWHSRVRGPAGIRRRAAGRRAERGDRDAGRGPDPRAAHHRRQPGARRRPNGRRLDRALSRPRVHGSSIDIYVNETTRHADVILPPASMLDARRTTTWSSTRFAVRNVARVNRRVRQARGRARSTGRSSTALGAAYREGGRRASTSRCRPPRDADRRRPGARRPTRPRRRRARGAPHGVDLGPLQPSLLRAPGDARTGASTARRDAVRRRPARVVRARSAASAVDGRAAPGRPPPPAQQQFLDAQRAPAGEGHAAPPAADARGRPARRAAWPTATRVRGDVRASARSRPKCARPSDVMPRRGLPAARLRPRSRGRAPAARWRRARRRELQRPVRRARGSTRLRQCGAQRDRDPRRSRLTRLSGGGRPRHAHARG